MNKEKLKLGTVFSGIGAIEHALKRMGIPFNIVFACDNDKFVKKSYFANYSIQEENWYADIKNINGKKYNNKIDLLVGGSPCQSFSKVGRRGGLEDEKGTLFYEFLRVIKESEPSVFIFENVKQLKYMRGGDMFKRVLSAFDQLGYSYSYELLNSSNFNVPQNRDRLFFVGFKDRSIKFYFPKGVKTFKKLGDFLNRKVEEKYYLTDKQIESYFSRGGSYVRRDNAYITNPLIARTLLTNPRCHVTCGNYIKDDKGIRILTPKEYLRFMGFGDDFKQVVSNYQIYKQAGNSIVVDVLIALIQNINLVNKVN